MQTPETMAILLVDQNTERVRLIREIFQENDCSVYSSDSCEEGIALYKQQDVSLILVGATLVDTNGWEFCRQIRNIAISLPIIALGSKKNAHECVLSKISGADSYITDVEDPNTFLEQVENTIIANDKKLSRKRNVSFAGDLMHLPLSESLQSLHRYLKTGCLNLRQGMLNGKIFFVEGEVVHATVDDFYYGVHAFFHLLFWESGAFRFHEGEISEESSITANLTSLLLEWTRLENELLRLLPKKLDDMEVLFVKDVIFSGTVSAEDALVASQRAKEQNERLVHVLESMKLITKSQVDSLYSRIEKVVQRTQKITSAKINVLTDESELQLQDSLVQKLVSAFSLLSAKQLEECIDEKANASEQITLRDVIVRKRYLLRETLDNLLQLRDDEGESLLFDYDVQDQIGQGARTIVYRGMHDGQEVAIKILVPNTEEGGQLVRRFIREAEISSQLEHPNIVKTLDFGNIYGLYYIIQEYVPGKSLDKIFSSSGALHEKECVFILKELAKGLQYLWHNDFIHRDLTPRNILFAKGADNIVKICDFGLAKSVHEKNKKELPITGTGIFLGTPGYIAPESFVNVDITFQVDVYSLGMSLFAISTGQIPNAISTQMHNSSVIPKYSEVRLNPRKKCPGLSKAFAALVMKFINIDPQQRCLSPEEFADDVARLQLGKKPRRLPGVSNTKKIAIAAIFCICLGGVFWGFSGQQKQDILTKFAKQRQLAMQAISEENFEAANRHFLRALNYSSLVSPLQEKQYHRVVEEQWIKVITKYMEKPSIENLARANKCCDYALAISENSTQLKKIKTDIAAQAKKLRLAAKPKQKTFSIQFDEAWLANVPDLNAPKKQLFFLREKIFLHIRFTTIDCQNKKILMVYSSEKFGVKQKTLSNIVANGSNYQVVELISHAKKFATHKVFVELQSGEISQQKEVGFSIGAASFPKIKWGKRRSLFKKNYLKRLASWKTIGTWAPSEEERGIFAVGTGQISRSLTKKNWCIEGEIKIQSQDKETGFKLEISSNNSIALSIQPIAKSYLISAVEWSNGRREVLSSKIFRAQAKPFRYAIQYHNKLLHIAVGKVELCTVAMNENPQRIALYTNKSRSVYFAKLIMRFLRSS